MTRPHDNRAWLLVLPVVIVFGATAALPFLALVNHAVQESVGPGPGLFVGAAWFREVLRDPELHAAFARQLAFSGLGFAIQIPLGLAIALTLPTRGRAVSVCLVLLALPLVLPWSVVGLVARLVASPEIGPAGWLLGQAGIVVDIDNEPLHAWIMLLAMDAWHWTPLVVLLCYAGLATVPTAHYRAAALDGAGAWAVFRWVQLPRLQGVLLIALLLRLVDSFAAYAAPTIATGGGPDGATTLLAQFVATAAADAPFGGPAAALAVVYLLVALLPAWLLFFALTRPGR